METCPYNYQNTTASCTSLLKNKGQETNRERNWTVYKNLTNFRLLKDHFALWLRVSELPILEFKLKSRPRGSERQKVRGVNFILPVRSNLIVRNSKKRFSSHPTFLDI